jgi:hypothetical protein
LTGQERIGDGGEVPSIEEMERCFSSWRKSEAIGDLLEKISSPIRLFFCYWGGDREAAEVALTAAPEPLFPYSP